MVGIISPEKANIMANEAGLDLVEISPNATPPVCKIMDFGKFKYDQQKREAEARKNQKTIDLGAGSPPWALALRGGDCAEGACYTRYVATLCGYVAPL